MSSGATPNWYLGTTLLVGGLLLSVFFALLIQSSAGDAGAALGGALGGGIGAIGAYLGVRETLSRQASDEASRRDVELLTVRHAVFVEVVISSELLRKCGLYLSRFSYDFEKFDKNYILLPDLTLTKAMSSQFGKLRTQELVALVKYIHTLADLRICVDSKTVIPITEHDIVPFRMLILNGCRYAKEFIEISQHHNNIGININNHVSNLQTIIEELSKQSNDIIAM